MVDTGNAGGDTLQEYSVWDKRSLKENCTKFQSKVVLVWVTLHIMLKKMRGNCLKIWSRGSC